MIRAGLLFGALFTLLALWIPRRWTELRFADRIFEASEAPQAPIGIVFGAGLRRNGSPTTILYDRVATAAQLFSDGKVEALLMSGHQTINGYDEPKAMRDLAVDLGVPAEAIVMDGGGSRTFTTCERALDTFGIEEALLVTQNYHLPRALAICEGIGLNSVGVSADLRQYSPRAVRFWEMREIPATLIALIETALARAG